MPAAQLDHPFPLSFATPLLKAFHPPRGPLDKARWVHSYRIHCLAAGGAQAAGSFRMERSPVGAGDFRLKVEHRKALDKNRAHTFSVDMRVRADDLATPLEWTFEESIAAPGALLPEPVVRGSVAASGGQLAVSIRGKTRRTTVAGPCASEYAVFEAVQRLASGPAAAHRFSLLTFDGRALPGHRLAFREEVDLPLPGGVLRLDAFEHTGHGRLPWVYYVTAEGRLVIAVSGLEAYIWDREEAGR